MGLLLLSPVLANTFEGLLAYSVLELNCYIRKSV